MELSGEEKKLQALFSELKADEEQAAPHFGATWNRAWIASRKVRVFNPVFVAATVLLVFGIVAFALWSRPRMSPSPQPMVAQAPPAPARTTNELSAASPTTPPDKKPEILAASHRNKATTRRAIMIAANRKLQKDAKSIANWTSPTSALLESPSDEIFSSLPELNQSATQLKSFLPSRSN
jgi:hypothetical protein